MSLVSVFQQGASKNVKVEKQGWLWQRKRTLRFFTSWGAARGCREGDRNTSADFSSPVSAYELNEERPTLYGLLSAM